MNKSTSHAVISQVTGAVICQVTGAVVSQVTGAVISQVTGAVRTQVTGYVGYLVLYHFSRYSSKSTSSSCSSLTLNGHKMNETHWLLQRSYKEDITIMPTSRDHLQRKQTPFLESSSQQIKVDRKSRVNI